MLGRTGDEPPPDACRHHRIADQGNRNMNALPTTKHFCRQCDRRVSLLEARICQSRFCKARQDWPITTARYNSPALLAAVATAEIGICELIFSAAGHDKGTVAAIRSGSTVERLCRMRQAVIWVAKERGYSFHKIARALNRDHSTIMHAYRIAGTLRGISPSFVTMCDELAG